MRKKATSTQIEMKNISALTVQITTGKLEKGEFNTHFVKLICAFNSESIARRIALDICRMDNKKDKDSAIYPIAHKHVQRILNEQIKMALTDALKLVEKEAQKRTITDLNNKLPHLSSDKVRSLRNRVARFANRKSKRRMNAPSPGRPQEKEFFFRSVKRAIRDLKVKGRAITQEAVAEELRCGVRAIRERHKNYGMNWPEVIRQCNDD
jgi:hypothetical protein